MQEIGDRLIDLSERSGLLSLRLCGPAAARRPASPLDKAARERAAQALHELAEEVEAFDPDQRRSEGLRPYCHASLIEWWRSYHSLASWLSPAAPDTRPPVDE